MVELINMEIKKEFSRKFITIIGAVLLLIIFLPSFYFYRKYQDLKRTVTNPNLLANSEIQKLVEKAGKLILLPKDENPTLYTVTDIEKVKSQPFFANAKNGDKVLIYSGARKAILYDPKADKIIEVGPLVIPSISPTVKPLAVSPTVVLTPLIRPTGPVTSPTAAINNPKIAIYNGSKTAGLASSAEDTINKEFPELTVLATGNAKGDYKENIIVDLKNSNTVIISKLQALFSATVVKSLPAEENAAGADIVILLGK